MMKLTEIIKAINTTLKQGFPDITIDSMDLSEQFHRPSFKVELDGLKTEHLNTNYKKRDFVIRIYYFPKDSKKSRLERLKVQDIMEDLFYLNLVVKEDEDGKFLLPIDELNFATTDGVLITSFETYTYEQLIKDIDLPTMDELQVKMNRR